MATFEKENEVLQDRSYRQHLDRNWSNGDKKFEAQDKRMADMGETDYPGSNEVTQARISVDGTEHTTLNGRLDDDELQAQKTEEDVNSIEKEIEDARTNVDGVSHETLKGRLDGSNKEIKNARGTFGNLAGREDNQDQKINANEVSLVNTNKSIEEVRGIAKAANGGGPKGTYATLDDLKKHKPHGSSNIYLVSADGHWYYYSGGWKDGGAYQAGIASPRMRPGMITTSLRFNINTTSKQIEFDDGYVGVADIYTQYNVSDAYAKKNLSLPYDSGFLWLNTENNTFVTTEKTGNALDNYVFLGFYFMNSGVFSFLGDYTIDGYKVKTVYDLPLLSYQAQLLSTKKVIIDRINKKVVFPKGGPFNVQVSNRVYKLEIAGTEMDLSANKGNYLFFNRENNKIVTQTSYVSASNEMAYLGYINFGSNFAVDLSMNYMVKDFSTEAKYAGQSFAALGDSTVNGDNGQGETSNSWSWVAYMSYLCGFSDVENDGVNGSRVTKGTSRTDSLVERYDTIKGKDFVAVMAGVNDFVNNMPLGEPSSIGSKYDITTFCGAYQTVIEGLKNNNPNARLLLITPLKVNNDRASAFTENSLGLKQKDYVDAIEGIAEMYGLRVHDLYSYAGFSPFLESDQIYTHDKLHPTELGYKVLASQIAGTINAM